MILNILTYAFRIFGSILILGILWIAFVFTRDAIKENVNKRRMFKAVDRILIESSKSTRNKREGEHQ